jgi:hypothetical protein
MKRHKATIAAIFASALTLLVAACGGGGGGTTSLPSTPANNAGGGGSSPTSAPNATATPLPTPTPLLQGAMQVASGGNATAGFAYAAIASGSQVVYTCGCSAQAGLSSTGASGSFTLPAFEQATPAAPSPTYTTVPGRNYLIVATASNAAESWTLEFLGNQLSTNYALGSNSTSDVYTAAGALYVYNFAPLSSDTAFDDWNILTVQSWLQHLRSAPNSAETQLLNDIATAEEQGQTLYPQPPLWNQSASTNATIRNDLSAVHGSGDAALPTPCPVNGSSAACTGTPSP